MTSTPQPDEPFNLDAYHNTWPTGATKTELIKGHPYFYGSFTESDVQTAERAFPGRRATLDADEDETGNLILHKATCGPGACPLWPA